MVGHIAITHVSYSQWVKTLQFEEADSRRRAPRRKSYVTVIWVRALGCGRRISPVTRTEDPTATDHSHKLVLVKRRSVIEIYYQFWPASYYLPTLFNLLEHP